jgi:NAD(P)-dependent dehydrogenase (short-subunit alcohol dehydrogenase family)
MRLVITLVSLADRWGTDLAEFAVTIVTVPDIGADLSNLPAILERTFMAQRTALVTGGNRGIGFAVCRALGQQGLAIVLSARDEAEGRRAEAELGGEGLDVAYYPLDVADPTSIARCRDLLAKDGVTVDVLVNNAGVYTAGDAVTVTAERIDEAWAVNARGPWLVCQAFVSGMRERGYGRIVNISSGSGSFAEGLDPGYAAYAVAKAALNAFTVCLARTLDGEDIKINAMCPGWVRTRMGGTSAPRTPEEAADTAVWLATLPKDGPSGAFFRDRQLIIW